jgi:S-adenosylmethionine:tRNA ribosyltransferase-isomerase
MTASHSISAYNYDLPDSSVAKYPLFERDQSKLLVWKNQALSDHRFSELPGLLPEGSMLVFNNTRVIRARLHFTKPTGAKIEVFCLEPTLPHEYVLSFARTTSCRWKCIVGNLKRWKGEVLAMEVVVEKDGKTEEQQEGKSESQTDSGKERREDMENGGLGDFVPEIGGQRLKFENYGPVMVVLKAEKMGELDGGVEIEFSWDNPNYSFAEILEAAGNIPIPPYLHRESEEIDSTVYQTIYSKIKGSVAAPTAGLHFTDTVFKELSERKISCEELTLHVGAGTFQPVKSDTIGAHQMHTEHFSVSKVLIDRMIAHTGNLIAVGTTSVRTLESLYWIGCKIITSPQIGADQLSVTQWEPYSDILQNIEAKVALQAISTYLSERNAETLETSTQIMILPGYRFRIIDGLVTNFHQPQSTLLLLIAAILGEDWKRVYAHALADGYRFLSYGDVNLYWLK